MFKVGKQKDVEQIVTDFYEDYGWVSDGDNNGEDKSFRQFRDFYTNYYNEVTRARELGQFEGINGKLLIAGGGDLPDSHQKIANTFSSVCCVDLSRRSLDICKKKLGDKGEYVHSSILDMPVSDNYTNAVFCSHVVYHIDANQQAAAIEQLIRVTKPGGKIVISYHNPNAPQNLLDSVVLAIKWPFRKVKKIISKRSESKGSNGVTAPAPTLYFKSLPLRFWKQFEASCEVDILPWQVFSASQEAKYIRSDAAAERFYTWAASFEEKNPRLAVRLWSYPLVVLTKK